MDLDKATFDLECPRCRFSLKIRFRDARLRDVLICRGCKANIHLDDNMNECRKARRAFQVAMKQLEQSLQGLNALFRF